MSAMQNSLSKRVMAAAKLRQKLRMDTAKNVASKCKGPQLRPTGVVELATWHAEPQHKIPDVAIGIITADRKGKPTIYPTITSLRTAGFKEKLHIFSESLNVSDIQLERRHQNIQIFRDSPKGCVPNWTRAARWLINNTDSPWIMILQDDVTWCSCGADILYFTLNSIDDGVGSIKRYRLGLLSPYTSPAMVPANASGIGWTEARFYGKTKGLWGALVLCFPREALASLLDNKRFKSHDSARALDYVVGDTLRHHTEPPLGVKIHLPSMAEHIGDNSTIFSKGTTANKHLQSLRQGYKFEEDSALWRKK